MEFLTASFFYPVFFVFILSIGLLRYYLLDDVEERYEDKLRLSYSTVPSFASSLIVISPDIVF